MAFSKTQEYDFIPSENRKMMNDTIDQFGREKILDYFHPERVPKPTSIEEGEAQRKQRLEIEHALADVSVFYPQSDIEQFMLQKPVLDAIQNRFKACVKQTWPEPEAGYTPNALTPTTTPPITQTPITDLALPSPEIPPFDRGVAGQRVQVLTSVMGIKPGTPANVLQLTITIQEEI